MHAFWAAISGDGSYITYTGGSWPAPNQLSLIKMKTTPPLQVWQANLPQSAFWRVDMPCHGKSIVVVNDDPSDSVGALAIYWNDGGNGWDAGDSIPVWTYWPDKDIGSAQNPLADFYTVAISESGNYIATGGTPHNTYLLKNDATIQQKIGIMPGSIQSVDLTLSGKYGVAGDNTGNVWFFDKDTGFKWSWMTGGAIHSVAISKVYPCMFPYPDHDVAVTSIKPNKTIVGQGYNANISITVTNEGDFQETFEVTLCTNSTVIGTQTVNNLAAGMSIILNFSWNTNSYEKGIYTVWASSSVVPDEIDVYDNQLVDSTIKVTIPGDVDGDFKVKMDDIVLIVGAFGSTLRADGWYWHTPPCILCPHNPNYDVDGNSKVDMGDIVITCGNFGKTYP